MQPCQSWAKPRRFGCRCLDQQTYPRSARNVGRSFASDRAEERSSSTWSATSCACHSATNSSAPAAPRAAWALPSWQCTEAASSEPCSFSSDASSTLAGSSDTFLGVGSSTHAALMKTVAIDATARPSHLIGRYPSTAYTEGSFITLTPLRLLATLDWRSSRPLSW